MTPSPFHVPPEPALDCAGARVCGGPPTRSRRFNVSPAKKPMDRLSGDQNGKFAPSVPASGWVVVAPSGRTHRRDSPSSDATNTICRPSGESAKSEGRSVAGVTMSTRISGGGGAGVWRRYRTAGTVSATSISPVNMPVIWRSELRVV
jgi:hypothetical protein